MNLDKFRNLEELEGMYEVVTTMVYTTCKYPKLWKRYALSKQGFRILLLRQLTSLMLASMQKKHPSMWPQWLRCACFGVTA